MLQQDPDPFELRGPRPQISVWMIARGVFWGQVMLIAVAALVGFVLGLFGIGFDRFRF